MAPSRSLLNWCRWVVLDSNIKLLVTTCHLACMVFFAIASAAACDKPPRYVIGPFGWDNGKDVVIALAIQPTDFSRNQLICLSEALKRRYRDYHAIDALIFDSKEAAMAYSGPQLVEDIPGHRAIVRRMHAIYHYDRQRGEESIVITPLGMERNGPFDMQIDLPAEGQVACKFNIQDRCLVALQDFEYPAAALKEGARGTVTLSARVSRDGAFSDVSVVRAEVSLTRWRQALTRSAVANLSTWRVEAGPKEHRIRITFVYESERSSVRRGEFEVTLSLPEAVVIRGYRDD